MTAHNIYISVSGTNIKPQLISLDFSCRLVDNLVKELEGIRSSGMVGDDDQMEVKTMVQAIACASQREAEAHETAIKLSKENDELCQKIKVLIEDNNKLIELYEQVAAENSSRALGNAEKDTSISSNAEAQNSAEIALEVEKSAAEELKKRIGNLENQLSEMHEENEKLMSLYENAMKEKDEFKRLLSSPGQEKLIKVDGVDASCSSDAEMELCKLSSETSSEDLNSARLKLELAQEKLSVSAKTIGVFSSLVLDMIKLSKQSKEAEDRVKEQQYELGSIRAVSDQTNARKDVAEKKLAALRCSLSNFASSAAYFEQREERARARVNATSHHLNQEKEKLDVLRCYKREIDAAMGKIQQSEAELKSNIVMLKIKVDEENRRHEEEKVLCAIDNIEKINTPQRNTLLTGKATDLLKSEEEKTKLQSEMKLSREKLASVRKEVDDMKKKSLKLDKEIKTVETEIEKSSKRRSESEMEMENTIQEKQALQEMKEEGMSEIQNMIIEIHQLVFESDRRKEEAMIVREELDAEELRAKEVHKATMETVEKALKTLEEKEKKEKSSGFSLTVVT